MKLAIVVLFLSLCANCLAKGKPVHRSVRTWQERVKECKNSVENTKSLDLDKQSQGQIQVLMAGIKSCVLTPSGLRVQTANLLNRGLILEPKARKVLTEVVVPAELLYPMLEQVLANKREPIVAGKK